MKIVGVIPARWASTRLPGKSLRPILGKPLIQWVVERAGKAAKLNALLVATDDDRIKAAVTAIGCEAVMTRADHPSGTDRVAEAVTGRCADIVINIQGDEPLIDPRLIDSLAETAASEPECDMVTAATPIAAEDELRNPSVVKVVSDRNGRALYFSRSPIPFIRDANFESTAPLHWRHIGIYAYQIRFLDKLVSTPACLMEKAESLEQLRALYIGGRIRVVSTEYGGVGVDTPEDISRAEAAIRKAGLA